MVRGRRDAVLIVFAELEKDFVFCGIIVGFTEMPKQSEPPADAHCVLVVEDHHLLQEVLALILRRKQFLIDAETDGSKAWELAQGKAYSMAIIDLVLPGLNGVELVRRIRGLRPDMPIIAISGRGMDLLDKAVEAGASAALAKPFTVEQMNTVLDNVAPELSKRRAGQRLE